MSRPTPPQCDWCHHTVNVVPAITQVVGPGIVVVTFACRSTLSATKRRCGRATAIVITAYEFPRYYFAETFQELQEQLIRRYGEKVRWNPVDTVTT